MHVLHLDILEISYKGTGFIAREACEHKNPRLTHHVELKNLDMLHREGTWSPFGLLAQCQHLQGHRRGTVAEDGEASRYRNPDSGVEIGNQVGSHHTVRQEEPILGF